MEKIVIVFLILLVVAAGLVSYFYLSQEKDLTLVSPGGVDINLQEKPLKQFSFNNLSQREFKGSEIKLDKVLAEEEKYISYLFFYDSDGYQISGMANLPVTEQSHTRSVVIMLRGYVDKETYYTGLGTEKAAAVLASNGYITLAPDFLDHGSSDQGEEDVWFQRFHNPVDVFNLIASVKTLGMADPSRIGIWGHSNGGQIALSVLEISGKPIPTTMWAPVSKPFPYNVLYFTDEFSDRGKYIRKELARLEKDYDVDDFSIIQYYDQIEAPMQIHQGTNDDAVPAQWSNELVDQLESLDKEVDYFLWQGADHNMRGSWDQVIVKDLEFFEKHL